MINSSKSNLHSSPLSFGPGRDQKSYKVELILLEKTPEPALEDHVHRPKKMGVWVLINEAWYYLVALIVHIPDPLQTTTVGSGGSRSLSTTTIKTPLNSATS